MSQYGFRAMLDSIDKKGEQRNLEFPEICTKDCPHTQCSSWGVPEMQGKPCRNIVPKTEEIKDKFKAKSNINEQILRTVKEAFKPLEDRLKRLENASNPVHRSFNGTPNEPLPVGFPRLFEELQRRQAYAD